MKCDLWLWGMEKLVIRSHLIKHLQQKPESTQDFHFPTPSLTPFAPPPLEWINILPTNLHWLLVYFVLTNLLICYNHTCPAYSFSSSPSSVAASGPKLSTALSQCLAMSTKYNAQLIASSEEWLHGMGLGMTWTCSFTRREDNWCLNDRLQLYSNHGPVTKGRDFNLMSTGLANTT